MSNYLTSEQITEYTMETGNKKANSPFLKSFLLAFMGGMFIALASIGSLIATSTIDNFSAASLIAGVVFATGLMMVVIAGGDLFTGNVLIIVAVLRRQVSVLKMLGNLIVVFLGNLAGGIFVVLLVQYSGMLVNGKGMILQKLLTKGAHKLEYPFMQAFLLGILCNLLVSLAVWMMYSAKDTGGKVLACFFPIMLFILSGYEHIVANMYYIPAAILAAGNSEYVKLSGVSMEVLAHLKVSQIPHNFIPVLLGNLVGGLIIGTAYAIIHRKPSACIGEQTAEVKSGAKA